MPLSALDAYQANDKYRATLRATWIYSPADATLQVTAIPDNLPTIVVVGWNTQYETVFAVTGTSGTNSSNYALTGLTALRGYGLTGNLPEGTAVNCLNNEEFFNQYGTALNEIIDAINDLDFPSSEVVGINDTQTLTNKTLTSPIITGPKITKRVVTNTSTASPTPNADTTDVYVLSAQAVTGAFAATTGTPTDGQGLIIRIKDNGTARALSFATGGTGGYVAGGSTLPTTTVTGKYLHLGFQYVTSNSLNKWMLVAKAQEA